MTPYEILAVSSRVAKLTRGFNMKMKKRASSGDSHCNFKGIAFYSRANAAEEKLHDFPDKIMLDMERLEFVGGKYIAFGRVYAVCSKSELLRLMTKLHFTDLHVYESLGAADRPHKLIIDIDRELMGEEGSERIHDLDNILNDLFIPAFCKFLNSRMQSEGGEQVTPQCVLILDASLPNYKYSKHLIVDTPGVLCPVDRIMEKQIMQLFQHEMKMPSNSNLRLDDFMHTSDGKSTIDYSIYTKGKRSMRMALACKGNGKTKTKPSRNLLPDCSHASRHSHASLPWWRFSCNVWGARHTFWRFANGTTATLKKLRIAVQPKRKHNQIHAQPRTRVSEGVPKCVESMMIKLAGVVHPRSTSISVAMKDIDDEDVAVCFINYSASETDGVRRCAFAAEEHNRHYSCLRMNSSGCVCYFCYGCQDSVELCGDIHAEPDHAQPAQGEDVTPPGDFASVLRGAVPKAALYTVSSRYVPALSMHLCHTPSICCIKSGMGTGKTHVIADYLRSQCDDPSVLSIGFRQTLNSSLAERFGLQDYKIAKDPLHSYRRLSLQVDSIGKLIETISPHIHTLRCQYDIIIVDEIESLLSHFLGDTMSSKVQSCWKLLEVILLSANRLILSDADMSTNTCALLRQLMQKDVSKTCSVVHNTTQTQHKNYVIMRDSSVFACKMVRCIRQSKKIYFASNSLKFSMYMKKIIEKHCNLKDSDIFFIHGKSSAKTKRDTAHCDRIWKNYQVVMCTPTVAAGVDFSEDWFDNTFVYGTSSSNTARELRQQIGRVRHTLSDIVYVCIDEKTSRVRAPTTYSSVAKDFDDIGKQRSIDLNTMVVGGHVRGGHVSISIAPCPPSLKVVLCNAQLEKNKSKNSMICEFAQRVSACGNSVIRIPKSGTSLKKVLARHLLTLEVEMQAAASYAEEPLVPGAHLDDENESSRAQHKACVCAFYAGVDIRSPGLFHHMQMDSVMKAASSIASMYTSNSSLYEFELTHGGLRNMTFTTSDGRSHTIRHSIVLERDGPAWEAKCAAHVLLFAAGGTNTGVETTGGVFSLDASSHLYDIIRGGLHTHLASARLSSDDMLEKWVTNRLIKSEMLSSADVAKAKAGCKLDRVICRAVAKWMNKKYSVGWAKNKYYYSGVGSERRAGPHGMRKHIRFVACEEENMFIFSAALLHSIAAACDPHNMVDASSAAGLCIALQRSDAGDIPDDVYNDMLKFHDSQSYVEKWKANARAAAAREWGGSQSGALKKNEASDNGQLMQIAPTWKLIDEDACKIIMQRAMSVAECLLT